MINKSKKEEANNIRSRLNALIKERKSWLNCCKEISEHITPERGRYNSKDYDYINRSSQYNSRPDKYLHNLASMLQSGLTSPARPWFKLTLSDTDIYEWGNIKDWLTKVEAIFEKTFRVTNFYPAIHSAYLELAAFGMVVMSTIEDNRSENLGLPIFTTYTAGEWVVDQNQYNEIDTLYRILYMNASDIVNRWPDSVSKNIEELSKKEPYSKIKVIHMVTPRKKFNSKKWDNINMPYLSIWLEYEATDTESGGILGESGFKYSPYHIARWDAVSDNPYGIGPGHKAVKDAKNLNLLDQIATYGLNKAVNPPIIVPAHMNIKLNNAPGGITYYAGNHLDSQIKPLYTIGSDLNAALTFMKRWEDILKETFQNDLFIFLLSRSNITATEINERNEEKLLLLGPVLERLQSELLIPMFERVYYILNKNGMIPEPPAELIGKDLRPEFTGLLAQAQKFIATQGIRSLTSFITQLTTIEPQVLDKVNIDQTLDTYSNMLGVPSGIIRSDKETVEIREKRNQQIKSANQQTENITQIKQLVDISKELSSIQKDNI